YVKWTATTSMPTSIEVLDLQGRLLFSVPAETTTRVDLSPLPAGTYFLKSGNATTKVVRK
ncbi:MAG: T9SS type A sorting domain-containing protein, partial [Bacteroidales bacterium]|nr:T9SS type A sorting domain-containing protein [Bacteroidales bacterium]